MVVTVKVSLQEYTTNEYAEKLGRVIASQVKEGIGGLSALPVNKVNVVMEDADGNNIGV